jgi:hypothetical protein
VKWIIMQPPARWLPRSSKACSKGIVFCQEKSHGPFTKEMTSNKLTHQLFTTDLTGSYRRLSIIMSS